MNSHCCCVYWIHYIASMLFCYENKNYCFVRSKMQPRQAQTALYFSYFGYFLNLFFLFFWQTIHYEVREREQLLILYVHAQLLVYERQLQQLVLKFATLSSICSISNTPQTAASKMTKKLNQHLSKTISTKTEHHNSHEVRICCRTVLLDCISFTYTWTTYD